MTAHAERALPAVPTRPLLYGALIAFTSLLAYELATDTEGNFTILESRPSIDRDALERFSNQIDGDEWWDPGQDPEEFRKFIKICIAIFGIGIVGAVLGMTRGDVDGLAQGRAPKEDPDGVINKLQRFIRKVRG
jgi:flavodoxin